MFTPAKHPLKDKSGAITAGGTAQEAYAKNDAPKYYCLFQNNSDTVMYIDFGIPATADTGIKIAAGVAWEPPGGVIFAGALSVLCATTGKKYCCKTA